MKLNLLVDGDILVYRCGFAAERKEYELYVPNEDGLLEYVQTFSGARELDKYCRDNNITEYERNVLHHVEEESHARQAVNTCLDSIMEAMKPSSLNIFLTRGPCFREQVATVKPYKGNRDKAARPVHYEAIREHLVNRWGAQYAPEGLEADDALAMWQAFHPDNCIVTIDKDLDQVPGWHYNWLLDDPKDRLYYVDAEYGDYLLCKQILTGDATDNIPGLPVFGPKKAEKVLDGIPHKQWLDVVRTTYQERWPDDSPLTPEQAMDEMAQLVYILRYEGDSWFNYKEVLGGGNLLHQ